MASEENHQLPINEDDQLIFNEEEEEEEFNYKEEETGNVPFFVSSISQEIDSSDMFISKLIKDINLCEAYFYDFKFDSSKLPNVIFKIPKTIIPLSTRVANGFYRSSYLIECQFELYPNDTYKNRPQTYKFTNPSYDALFPGSILVKTRFRNFFNVDYKPPTNYRCQNYVLLPPSTHDQAALYENIEILMSEGFFREKAEKALLFCSNDVSRAREYLISGLMKQETYPLPLKYPDCPLFYLVLELCEAFFDMSDCCCICGKKLGVTYLKPVCCDDKQCQFSFMDLGVGTNIIGEMKRDPYATDFLISLAGAAYNAPQDPPVFDPSPETQGIKFDKNFFEKLPSIESMCKKCKTDGDLRRMIGENYFETLRFFILANKAQLITLTKPVKVDTNIRAIQFLVTSVSPESELIFQSKKEKYGVKWLWHGSRADRWYRILHTGLKDLGRTDYQLNGGPWFGDGIYMSDSFHVSFGLYCTGIENIYANSMLPSMLYVVSLVENAANDYLKNSVAPNEYTQRDESACITRVLYLVDPICKANDTIEYNTLHKPPKVPQLYEVLSQQMKRFI